MRFAMACLRDFLGLGLAFLACRSIHGCSGEPPGRDEVADSLDAPVAEKLDPRNASDSAGRYVFLTFILTFG